VSRAQLGSISADAQNKAACARGREATDQRNGGDVAREIPVAVLLLARYALRLERFRRVARR
jgi:hypothetical protein